MPNQLIKEQVDIDVCPTPGPASPNLDGKQITIGDLHGNALKLMFMLVKQGIATIAPEQYQRLVSIYKMDISALTKAHLEAFNLILSGVTFQGHRLVRLLGDELADRGQNDYFTLKILQKLHQAHVRVEIIVSNHSLEFIHACESKDLFEGTVIHPDQVKSMTNLQELVEKGIVDRQEILQIKQDCYNSTVRAISYSLRKDRPAITIYSHAGIGLDTIEDLAKKLSVPYNDKTASQLAHTIDNINRAFQQHVQSNTVHMLYEPRAILELADPGHGLDLGLFPLESLTWNREYDHLWRPAAHHGYRLVFAHGHDAGELTHGNIINLDNILGKSLRSHKEEYTAVCSDEYDLKAQFLDRLQAIAIKREHLPPNGPAYRAADTLYKTVTERYEELKKSPVLMHEFQRSCRDAISAARPALAVHRRTPFLFFMKTDSIHKLDRLADAIACLPTPAEIENSSALRPA